MIFSAMVIWYVLGSVVLVSLIAIIAAIPLLIKKQLPKQLLLSLLSVSVGTLLGAVFIHFIPEMISDGYMLSEALYLFAGFLAFFILEKLVHWHHNHKKIGKECAGHSHAYHLAPLNLIGDGVHNFLDGLVIAGAYVVSIPLGIAATISVIFHEVPQEIADFGILLYSGMSRFKALLFNFLSAATAIVGGLAGLFLAGNIAGFSSFIIPFAAGNFLYIAASNLVPELHRECSLKHAILHIAMILVGLGIMVAVVILGPAHMH
jgi:zinc and cadmium transporter